MGDILVVASVVVCFEASYLCVSYLCVYRRSSCVLRRHSSVSIGLPSMSRGRVTQSTLKNGLPILFLALSSSRGMRDGICKVVLLLALLWIGSSGMTVGIERMQFCRVERAQPKRQ